MLVDDKIKVNKDIFDNIVALCVKLKQQIGVAKTQELFDGAIKNVENELSDILKMSQEQYELNIDE